MNITNFKQSVRDNKSLNKAESKRLDNITSRDLKHTLKSELGISNKDLNDGNINKVWHKVNQSEAKQDAFHRKQNHEMRVSKSTHKDYSSTSYNNHTEDL